MPGTDCHPVDCHSGRHIPGVVSHHQRAGMGVLVRIHVHHVRASLLRPHRPLSEETRLPVLRLVFNLRFLSLLEKN